MLNVNKDNYKVLLIEDDQILLNVISEMLKMYGFNTINAKNGEKGIKLLKRKNPDLVLCDVILQGKMDGFSILDQVRNDPRYLLTPFILITGKTERSDFRRGMELGADDYIFKPFTEDELLKAIRIQLARVEAIKNKFSEAFVNSSENTSIEDDIIYSEEKDKKFTDNDQILITVEKEPRFLKLSKLVCITSLGDYSSVFTSDNYKFVIRKTLKWWESKLPEKSFFRIHRSTIINLNFIEKIERWFNSAYRVHLKNIGKPFTISRRSGSKLKTKFS